MKELALFQDLKAEGRIEGFEKAILIINGLNNGMTDEELSTKFLVSHEMIGKIRDEMNSRS